MIPYHLALIQAAHEAHAQGDATAADAALRMALGHDPADGHVLYFLGHLAYVQGRLDAAAWFLARALQQAPGHARAHNDLGETLRALGRMDEAIPHLEQAAALEPTLVQAHGNLVQTLLCLGRDKEALARARRSAIQSADTPTALCDLASLLSRLGRPEEALAQYAAAIALRPADPRPHYFAGLMRLALGELPAAWADHERRLDMADGIAGRIEPRASRWNGETVRPGTRILLHSEQGFGDTIQFARYATMVAAQGATVLLDVPVGLGRLLATVPGVASVHERGTPVPPFDLHCPLMSLPHVFATSEATIPTTIPYLAAPDDGRARWRQRLAAHRRPRVGLAWSGRPSHAADADRSIPLAAMAGLLEAADVSWIGVQHDVRDADAATLGGLGRLTNLGAEATDFADTAALVAELDLVISVDTSVVHLAGALGRPAWVLLPYAADWRWMRGRGDSPWYPSLRLFRQPARGDWVSVLATAGVALNRWTQAGRA